MPNNFLVPEAQVEANGNGPALELWSSAGQTILLSLGVTKFAEQQIPGRFHLGLRRRQERGPKPLLAFPQIYVGIYAILLDLGKHPEMSTCRRGGAWRPPNRCSNSTCSPSLHRLRWRPDR